MGVNDDFVKKVILVWGGEDESLIGVVFREIGGR